MKKLLCIAIMTNAAEKKEIVTNNSKEIKVEKATFEKIGDNTLTLNMFFGCGSDGNQIYDIEIANGATHREARAIRRAWVRNCRGNFWQF